MIVTADQILVHALGDYILQSDWMASEKTKQHTAALAHAVVYSLPFLLFKPSMLAFAVILTTHFFIDRYRLARYVCWAKNFLAPKWLTHYPVRDGHTFYNKRRNLPWTECSATGYPPDRPAWLAVWLLIFADNILHVGINGLALKFL